MKDAVIEIIKWIRESVRPVVVAFFLSALMLFLPSSWFAAIGIENSVHTYRFVASLFFAGSFLWLVTFPIERRYRLWERRRSIERLAADQKEALKTYIVNNKTVGAYGFITVACARNLQRLGILIDMGTADGHGNPYFAIDPWTREYLREHPELIGLPKN
jgi:hypothetical protein